MLDAILVVLAGGLGEPDRHHLRGIVPFIDRARDIEAFVALQADQLSAERGGEHLRDLRLADARLAFEKQRPPEAQAQEDDGRQRAVADIRGAAAAAPSVSSIEVAARRGRQFACSACGYSKERPAVGRRARSNERAALTLREKVAMASDAVFDGYGRMRVRKRTTRHAQAERPQPSARRRGSGKPSLSPPPPPRVSPSRR